MLKDYINKIWKKQDKAVSIDPHKFLKLCELKENKGKVLVIAGSSFSGKDEVLGTLSGLSLENVLAGKKKPLGIGFAPKSFPFYKGSYLKKEITYTQKLKRLTKSGTGKKPDTKPDPGNTADENAEFTDQLIQQLNVEALLKTKFKKLSAGQLQKANIAQAFLENPDLVILDEPFNDLDQYETDQILNWISNYKKNFIKEKMLVIFTSRLSFLFDIADGVIFTPKFPYDKPLDPSSISKNLSVYRISQEQWSELRKKNSNIRHRKIGDQIRIILEHGKGSNAMLAFTKNRENLSPEDIFVYYT